MVELKVAIETRSAVQSLNQLDEAIDRTGTSAVDSAQKIDTIGRRVSETMPKAAADALKLNRAIETVGEVTQVGSRVRLLGEEIRNIGSGAGTAAGAVSAFGGILFDVAQISEKTGGSLGALGSALRANPILAAAGVFSLIASAMALFGRETADTNSELSKQIRLQDELRRASLDLAQQLQRDADFQRVGLPVDLQQSALTRVRRLTETASSLAGTTGTQSFADLTALTGLSREDLRRLAPAGGVVFEDNNRRNPSSFPRELGLTNEAAREVLLILAREARVFSRLEPTLAEQESLRGRQASLVGGVVGPVAEDPYRLALSAYQRGAPQPNLDSVGFAGPTPFGPPVDIGQLQQAEQAQAEFNRELERTRQLGVDVGTALGNSFFAFAQNASNARSVLVGLLQQLSAIAQQRIVQGFANAVGNAFAPTNTQQTTRTPGTE